MSYSTVLPGLIEVRGTHYNPGAEFLYFIRRTNNGSGVISKIPLNPSTLIAEGVNVAFSSGQVNLNSYGNSDLQRPSATQIRAINNARIAPLAGVTSLSAVTTEALLNVNWSAIANNNTLPENGTSATGNFYAVRIPALNGDYNYAKVRVYSSGSGTRIDWVTYLLSANAIQVSPPYGDLRDIIVSDYESEIYVSGFDGAEGYVARAERVVAGPYPQYTLTPSRINMDPLDEPQQLAADGGVIYVVDDTSLWRIDPLNAKQELVVSGLDGGTGLLLDMNGAVVKAYIAESSGNIRVVSVSDYSGSSPIPAPPPAYTVGGRLGFLTWADEEHTAIYVPDQDSNTVRRLDLTTGEASVEVSALPIPWSVEVISPNELYIASESEIGRLSRTITPTGVLPLGIGLVPFQYINNSEVITTSPGPHDGKVNTSSSPGYYFSQYGDLPLGGSLSLMINHELAWTSGIRYYRLSLRNLATGQTRAITGSFTDQRWNASLLPPRFEAVSTAPTNGAFPIRNPAELWYNPYLAAVIATNTNDNGHNVLKMEFLNASMQPVPNGTFERLLLIDNTRYGGRLEFPRIGTDTTAPAAGVYPTLDCGCLTYNTKNDLLEIDFGAWQPQATGNYSLTVSRGSTGLPLLQQTGSVTAGQTLQTKSTTSANKPIRAGHLVGNCDVANIVIHLSVPSRVIDGFGWVNLSASFSRSFTMLKAPLSHSPWSEP